MSKVYMAYSGEYEGYGIDAIFSTREDAEFFCEVVNAELGKFDDRVAIEERELDPQVDLARQGWRTFRFLMTETGAVMGKIEELWPWEQEMEVSPIFVTKAGRLKKMRRYHVRAKSSDEAIQIARDHLAGLV